MMQIDVDWSHANESAQELSLFPHLPLLDLVGAHTISLYQ